MRFSRSTIGVVAATAAVLTTGVGVAAAATTETVRPSDVGTGWYTADTRLPGSTTFEDTYGGALGDAAVVLRTPTGSAKAQLLTDEWSGTALAEITEIGYSTYRADAPPNSPALAALNIRVDLDGNGITDRYLVFEPYQAYGNAAIQDDVWQTWDALDGGNAQWWLSGPALGNACPQSNTCAWDELLVHYPDAQILEGLDFQGSFGFNQGSGNDGVVTAADELSIGTADRAVTYDFELDVTLSGKDDCKKGGWAESTDPVFRNQGDCVSYFASNG